MESTNSVAYLTTDPVKNTNTHQIVEGHMRYWAKFDAEEEAERKKQEAQQEEFARKKQKLGFDNYKGLSDLEAKGYFTEQVVNYKNANADEWLRLSKASANGDEQATIQLSREKEKLQNLITASTTISGKVAELQALKEKGTYNELRDKPLEDFVSSLNKGVYQITENGKYKVYSKENDELLEVDPLRLQSDFMKSTYHKKVNFDIIGDAVAGSIKLKNRDGNKSITPADVKVGIDRVHNVFKQDPNVLTTWALSKGLKKTASELNDVERNDLATQFFEEQVRSNIGEAVKTATTTSDSTDNSGGGISIANDENNVPLKELAVEGHGTFSGDIINAPSGGIKLTTKNKNSNRTTTITMFGRNKNGKLVGFGEEVVTIPETYVQENGENKLDAYGYEIVDKPKHEKKKAVIVHDRAELNKFATQIDGISNLGELADAINEATGVKKTQTKTNSKIDSLPDLD